MERYSGILMPLSSLPSPHGIGTLGKAAYDFIDFLSASGQRYWQLLPLCPSSCGNSPYSSYSTFAGEALYIDLDILASEGYLKSSEIEELEWGDDGEKTDYDLVLHNSDILLRRAFERRFWLEKGRVTNFRKENRWVDDYSLYMALKKHFNMASWTEWPEDIASRESQALERYSRLLRDEADYYAFCQYLFYAQWDKLHEYAVEKGIAFIGDMPIYVSLDSVDVWSEKRFFLLDEKNVPVEVAGVPPDAFTEEGQLWGNPLFDYDEMARDGYGWWIRRMDGARRLYDTVRIDHFRGFESYWAVKYGEKSAKNGVWRTGPGMKLVGVFTSWFYDLHYIAEDLGIITDGVRQLLRDSGLPGMKVLQFAFDAEGESDYLPHNCTENSICYVGTHDNDTVMGWLETESAENVEFARDYMHITPDEGWCWGFIRTGMATRSRIFIVSMQDVLELPHSARMNTPGVAEGNWTWRMSHDAITPALTQKLLRYTQTYRRARVKENEING